MWKILSDICDKIGDFSLNYGIYIICFLVGYLTAMFCWWRRRPEDFIHRTDETGLETEETR